MQNEPPIATTPLPEAPATQQEFRLEFTGNSAEYFRIWIVNVALTIVTLGVYSAWAKVRNKQYFYGHTRLAGSSFEYTANPVAILKGRLLVLSALVIYQLASFTQPALGLAMGLALIPLLPWIVIKAVGFNLRYSSYRNLRFHFDGRYPQAFTLYILWSFVIGISGGIAYPYVVWQRKRFLVDQARFGHANFNFTGEAGYFYLVYICAILIILVAAIGLPFIVAGVGALSQAGSNTAGTEHVKVMNVAILVVMTLGFTLLAVIFHSAVQALISNFIWQHTTLKGIGFNLRLEVLRVAWIQMSNIAAIIVSIGLLIPWARVRMLRYRLSRFSLHAAATELDEFVAGERAGITATGSEFGDALDLDLGL